MNHIEIIRKAISVYGVEAQTNQTIEECAELILAIRHFDKGKCDITALISEIADVGIMIDQMKIMYGVEECAIEKQFKINRLAARLNITP